MSARALATFAVLTVVVAGSAGRASAQYPPDAAPVGPGSAYVGGQPVVSSPGFTYPNFHQTAFTEPRALPTPEKIRGSSRRACTKDSPGTATRIVRNFSISNASPFRPDRF